MKLRFGRRRRRLSLGVVMVAAVLALVADRYDPAAPASPAPTATAVAHTWATVVLVTDGDTIRVRLDGTTKDESLRLIGVDTPETVHPTEPDGCYGAEASAFALTMLTGQRVMVEWDVERRQQSGRGAGRLLGYVWTDPTKDSLLDMFNARLVWEGYATALAVRPNTAHATWFDELEAEAQRRRVGMWSACPMGATDG